MTDDQEPAVEQETQDGLEEIEGQEPAEAGEAAPDTAEVVDTEPEADGAEVTVSTGTGLKPGDVVSALKDGRLHGKVMAVRTGEDGREFLQVEGFGNWLPADGFRLEEEGPEPEEKAEAEPERFEFARGEQVESRVDPSVRGRVTRRGRDEAGEERICVHGFGNWFPARQFRSRD